MPGIEFLDKLIKVMELRAKIRPPSIPARLSALRRRSYHLPGEHDQERHGDWADEVYHGTGEDRVNSILKNGLIGGEPITRRVFTTDKKNEAFYWAKIHGGDKFAIVVVKKPADVPGMERQVDGRFPTGWYLISGVIEPKYIDRIEIYDKGAYEGKDAAIKIVRPRRKKFNYQQFDEAYIVIPLDDSLISYADNQVAVAALRRRSYHLPGEHDQERHGDWAAGGITETPAFKAWFGNSKVVDADGKPMVVYHKTPKDFKEFKPGGNNPRESGPAIWMTPNSEVQNAAHHTEGKENVNVMPLYVHIKRPLIVDDDTRAWVKELYGPDFPYLIKPGTVSALKAEGYDGILFHWHTDLEEVIAFSPSQIKSKFNKGTFNPKDKRISYSKGAVSTTLKGHHLALLGFDYADTDELRRVRKDFAAYLTSQGVTDAEDTAGAIDHSWELATKSLGQSFLANYAWRGALNLTRGSEGLKLFELYREIKRHDAYQPHEDDPGVMIAVKVPKAVGEQLAVKDGNKPADMHCTLLYLGRLSVVEKMLPEVRRALAEMAPNYPSMTGVINGLGRFGAGESSDGKEVIYATLDCPGLARLREDLVGVVEAVGVEVSKEHDFTPHITLSYVEPGKELDVPLPDYEIEVSHISLVIGGMTEQIFGLGPKTYHLPGEHDQEKHGNWAEGMASGDGGDGEKGLANSYGDFISKVKYVSPVTSETRQEFEGAVYNVLAKLPPHVREKVSGVIENVLVAVDANAHYSASYGGGRMSFNMARWLQGRTYSTWDHIYKENTTHGLADSIYHELGHAAEHSIAKDLTVRQSWRDVVGLASGQELADRGLEKVMTPLPPELAKRREFKKGGDHEWNILGWTYKGYKRLTAVVSWRRDSANRVRDITSYKPTLKSSYVKDTFKPPTAYAGSNARELFADSFMLYHHAPDKLKARSPEIYTWMDKWHKN